MSLVVFYAGGGNPVSKKRLTVLLILIGVVGIGQASIEKNGRFATTNAVSYSSSQLPEAVRRALNYISEIYGKRQSERKFRLNAVRNDDEKYWSLFFVYLPETPDDTVYLMMYDDGRIE